MRLTENPQPKQKISQRLILIDLIRGLAIIGVAIYHLAWDLAFLGFISIDVGRDLAWSVFARVLAGSFVGLAGVSLVLAHHQGIRWPAFWRRIGILTGAAVAITATTLLTFPQTFIYFGILHAIALFSILALPFLLVPTWMLLIVAGSVFALPGHFRSPAFNERWLAWIGLGTDVPPSNDFEPLFPWFGLVVLGIVIGRALLTFGMIEKLSWQPQGGLVRLLTRAGRQSLVIYLVHQPILLGILYPIAWVWPPRAANLDASFLQACQASCARNAESEVACRTSCECSARELKKAGLWSLIERPQLTPDQQRRINQTVRVCFGAAQHPPPGAAPD
ncbi:DUF1624 domain-containing protein [Microvirga sp. VF16]|uniref:DUF1624 domain-containing protein n=1 Tax=Microvirga sp. VF16 TaxID=2807101 RepID=UPI00193DF496|nr:heparan-alpha-glucosaminide N-acetyltransferase [Microvirga sp. VF16]QRM35212.1 DUF1624 domain-containing protein [Microvirga sp. VF16]